MNQKPSPLSALKSITPEQSDQLFELLRVSPYYVAVKWIAEQWNLTVSISGLRRWWKRETARRARADLRSAISASEKFDTKLDKRALDTRAANALRAAFWNAIANRDVDSIETLGKMVLNYNADDRDTEKMQRLLVAEKKFEEALSQVEIYRQQIEELKVKLAEAGKSVAADPAKVSDEVDRILGVKK